MSSGGVSLKRRPCPPSRPSLQRSAPEPAGPGHAGRGRAAPRQRRRPPRERARGREPLDGHAARGHRPSRQDAAGRRRGPRPLAVRRPGPEPRARGRGEPRLEARGAGRPARQPRGRVPAGGGGRWRRPSWPTCSPRRRSCGPTTSDAWSATGRSAKPAARSTTSWGTAGAFSSMRHPEERRPGSPQPPRGKHAASPSTPGRRRCSAPTPASPGRAGETARTAWRTRSGAGSGGCRRPARGRDGGRAGRLESFSHSHILASAASCVRKDPEKCRARRGHAGQQGSDTLHRSHRAGKPTARAAPSARHRARRGSPIARSAPAAIKRLAAFGRRHR